MAESAGFPSPSSPKASPVQLSHCIEELLEFVLESTVNGTLGVDIGLPKDYCTTLLSRDSPHSLTPSIPCVFQESQQYPLYKQLASALLQCITTGTYPCEEAPADYECASLRDIKHKVKEFLLDKGSQLASMLKRINFELHVQEPYFSQLKDNLKTVEGRCAVGDYNRVESGALLLFNKCLILEVQDVHRYASFREMLEVEGLEKVLPGVVTIEEGVNVYRRFYTEEKERLNGVFALYVSRPDYQPYIALASILSGLGYKGIRGLLGLANTV